MTRITLLDGGMGQELMRRREGPAPALWSAQVMLEAPELVRGVHEDFLRAGARVLTLNAYSVTRPKLQAAGLEARFEPLLRAAGRLAAEARAACGGTAALAACLPPLARSYRPDLAPPEDEAEALWREMAALQDGADLLLAETLSSVAEGRAALAAARADGRPIWIGFTVDDSDGTRLRSGEPLSEAVAAAAQAEAVLVNCSAPEAVDQAVRVLKESVRRWGAYANGFTALTPEFLAGATVDALSAREDLTPGAYAARATAWAEAGASILGGCCEVGPAHIAALAGALERGGHAPSGP